MRALKALAVLLTYPEAGLIAALPEVEAVLREEGLIGKANQTGLARLLGYFAETELMAAQEAYVATFDRSRQLSLHLFEHLHGDSRERGPAMVDLAAMYRADGLEPAPGELPDFLPLFLEYLSAIDWPRARALLHEVEHILRPLRDRLDKRGLPQAAVLTALLELAGCARTPATTLDDEPADDDLAALDRAWEEAAVVFGPGAEPGQQASCSRAAAMLARMSGNS